MLKALSMLLVCVVAVSGPCQAASSKYQSATIVSVKPHPAASSANSSSTGYDITLRVGSIEYLTLYTPPPGTYGVEYAAGYELLVLVGTKTITFNDMLGNSRKAAILSRRAVPEKSTP